MFTGLGLAASLLTGCLFVSHIWSQSRADEKDVLGQIDQMSDEPWGDTANGFRMSIRTDKDEYRYGDPVRLTVSVQNMAADSRRILLGPFTDVYNVYITGPTGEPIPRTLYGVHERGSVISFSGADLEPAEVFREVMPALNRRFDMSMPGIYRIVVRRRFLIQADSPPVDGTASDAVVIKVVDRP